MFEAEQESHAGGPQVHLPTGVARLHQTMGNAALARQLAERRALQSAEYQPHVKLERVLNDEDRVRSGERGEHVAAIQQGLMRDGIDLPQFGADGVYGGETASAVRQFKTKHNLGFTQFGDVGPGTMGKLDELGTRPQPPEPTPPGPNPPGPTPPAIDPALERRLDLIVLEYLSILREQTDALATIERDLHDMENPTDSIIFDLLKMAAEKIITGLLGPGGGMLFKVVESALKVSASGTVAETFNELMDKGVTKVFESIESQAKEGVGNKLTGSDSATPPEGALPLFIDAQRHGLFDATHRAIDTLNSETRPKLRTMQPKPGETPEDPATYRVHRAQDLHIAVREGEAQAHEKQYFKTLREWSAYLAQLRLGTARTFDPDNPSPENDPLGTDFNRLREIDPANTDVRGVLEVSVGDIDEDDPKDISREMKAEQLHISGLSKKMRKKLNEQFSNKTIGELGLPRRVMDAKKGLLTNPLEARELRVGRNEFGGDTFDLGSTASGKEWLRKRGLSVGVEDPARAEFVGMASVMNDIDNVKISEVKDGIQGPD
jgi:hypothetical protein